MGNPSCFFLFGILLGVLVVAINGEGGTPPGGAFSSCCPLDVHACNHFPIDNQFKPKNCNHYAAFTGISCATRQFFMQMAINQSLAHFGTPCPFNAFFALVVNHTAGPGIGDAVVLCNVSSESRTFGPMWHGEMRAFNQCDALINANFGSGKAANPLIWQQLTMYTTGESCTMCISAARFHRLGEMVSAVSDVTLDDLGWAGVEAFPDVIQQRSNMCAFGDGSTTSYQTRLIQEVLADEIEQYFAWQFRPQNNCPTGCHRATINNFLTCTAD